MNEENLYSRIYSKVKLVPAGHVTTYGDLANRLGTTARVIGFAMASLPAEHDVPWHRVINSKGQISKRGVGDSADIQKMLLEAEGVVFDEQQRVDLESCLWTFDEGVQ